MARNRAGAERRLSVVAVAPAGPRLGQRPEQRRATRSRRGYGKRAKMAERDRRSGNGRFALCSIWSRGGLNDLAVADSRGARSDARHARKAAVKVLDRRALNWRTR